MAILAEGARARYPAPKFPFSDELCAFMGANPIFEQSLKVANPTRFRFLGKLITSRTPDGHPRARDQVIGLWFLDLQQLAASLRPLFKQDFIVNVSNEGTSFVSYAANWTKATLPAAPCVRLIDDFFRDYGEGGRFYHGGERWQHHFDEVDDLPRELQENGRRAKAIP